MHSIDYDIYSTVWYSVLRTAQSSDRIDWPLSLRHTFLKSVLHIPQALTVRLLSEQALSPLTHALIARMDMDNDMASRHAHPAYHLPGSGKRASSCVGRDHTT